MGDKGLMGAGVLVHDSRQNLEVSKKSTRYVKYGIENDYLVLRLTRMKLHFCEAIEIKDLTGK